jgi:hypothetical protein
MLEAGSFTAALSIPFQAFPSATDNAEIETSARSRYAT